MTEPEDWMIRPAFNTVHSNLAPTSQMQGLNQSQMDMFNQWGQNIATQTGLADGSIPVVGTMATGTVNSQTVGVGPPTSVAVSTTNMLVSQNFTSADTVVTQGEWSWDGDDGNLTLGCARVDCNGAQEDLVSNEIPVLVGENITVACQVKWEDLVYTGTKPIILGVERYRQGKDPDTGGITFLDLGGVDIAWFTSPPASGGWGTDGDLAGTYVVEAGVDQLRFRFRAATTITEGIVKWDEAVFLKLDLIADNAVPGVGTTVDNIVTGLFGSEGDSFTHNDAAVALGNTSAAILSINARLSATEAEASPGAIAGDDFPWSGEITADANWGGAYTATYGVGGANLSGSYIANGADAAWHLAPSLAGLETQTFRFDWQGTGDVSDTNYQLIQLLLSTAPSIGPAGSPWKSYIHLLGRISSGFGSYVRAGFGSDGTYFVDYTTNGTTFTTMRSGTCAVPGSGSLLSLYCGNQATTAPRHFKLKINGAIIVEFDETGSGSPLGVSNLKWGWGGKAEGGYYIAGFVGNVAQAVPPKVNQWLGYDQ